MKIYTFGALGTTRVEILWSLRPKDRDPIFTPYIDGANHIEVDSIQDCEIAIYPRRVFHPETLEFDDRVYDAATKAKRYNKPLIVDGTSDSDVFLNLPNTHILRCGLYKSLQQPFETECPFWSNYRTKNKLDALKISSKPKKPTIGFCGTTSSMGTLSNIAKFAAPSILTKYILSQGKRASQVDIRLREGMSLKLREIAVNLLTSDKRLNSYFDLTNDHKSYYSNDENNRIALENLFIENTSKSDYILCVRGTGNYSGRFYMALNAGRIPIVLDTDLVIPFEDKLHIIKISLESLAQIGDIILEHFENTTEGEFKAIKAQNREVYRQFIAPERFFNNFINNIVE
ncbi:hypothetical protein I4641_03015 [Waterburya agarophytonicola K14]|uniref:Exostosin GT47 domain-containing protein n=1 Tax=Waterburya agarophytonicola KI4 TaxID=2874699 RepID=A0A964BPU8_9CYAN|nr:hypothetical protein [Waterburya agarophytonicola]MCC0175951.1 hypothetical protein [Waterburya agarophytonicola KI4]